MYRYMKCITYQVPINSTLRFNSSRYKALRSAGGLRRPLRSLRKEKYIKLREADRRSMIGYEVYTRYQVYIFMIVVVANWRLDNA